MMQIPMPQEKLAINMTTHYPRSDTYDYTTMLTRIHLDQERIWDITHDQGFIITEPKAVKDDIKDPNGIYSSRFGQTVNDVDEFSNRYRCKCGHTKAHFMHGLRCEVCGEPVKFVGDNFNYFGWICLKDPYWIIHPNLYMTLAFFIGTKKFLNIITPVNEMDQDGNIKEIDRPKDEPFYGIGISQFHERFKEIIDYYTKKNGKNKRDYLQDILDNWDNIFTQSIPVYTIHLRPFRLDGGEFHFEGTNAIYNMMAHLASKINNDRYKFNQKTKPKEQLLFDLQSKYMELYTEIVNILSGKKGSARALFGGRWNFSSRLVIVPEPTLRIDEVKLSYQALCGLMEQTILNVLRKSYSMTFIQAKKFLDANIAIPNKTIIKVLEGLIHDAGRGIPLLINRNPTIALGGILQMYCVGISEGFTMSMPLEVLDGLAADFDSYVIRTIRKEIVLTLQYRVQIQSNLYLPKWLIAGNSKSSIYIVLSNNRW